MFRTFIYLDEEKLYAYKRLIEGKNEPRLKDVTKKKSAGITADFGQVGLNAATETSVSGEYQRDVEFDYDRFEIGLETLDGEDYFDCVLNYDYDLTTIPSMKIIRICGGLLIPESFDVVTLFQQFMPLLMGQVPTASEIEEGALQTYLGNARADIPFIVECDDITVSGKLNAKNLLEDYTALEEYEDQEVYLLCKVIGVSRKEKVEIFDPLKDFIKLPRAVRRSKDMKGETMGLEKISVDGPVLKVEVIAMYK